MIEQGIIQMSYPLFLFRIQSLILKKHTENAYSDSSFRFNGKEWEGRALRNRPVAYFSEGARLSLWRRNFYYGARYYDPKISVWLSVDPLAKDFPGWTPYHFVHNSPLNLVDPKGMAAVDPGDGDPTKPPKTDRGPERLPEGTNPHIPRPVGSGSGGSGSSSTESDPYATEPCDGCGVIGGAGGLEWISTGGISVVKAAKTLHGFYKAYRAGKTLKGVMKLLKPGGKLIGKQAGRRPDIRTLSPEGAKQLIEGLKKLGAKVVPRKGYPGTWYELPYGIGGFGIRNSVSNASKAKGSSSAIDFSISGLEWLSNIKF